MNSTVLRSVGFVFACALLALALAVASTTVYALVERSDNSILLVLSLAATAFAGVMTFIPRRARYGRGLVIGAMVVLLGTTLYLRGHKTVPNFFAGKYIQSWNVYHYYLGSKYFDELGYFDLYKYTFKADREGDRLLVRQKMTRDLRTYDMVRVDQEVASITESAFSPERWEEFKHDLSTILHLTNGSTRRRMTSDLGYNAPPFANAVFSALSHAFPLDQLPSRLFVLGLDWILFIPTFILAGYAFGPARGLLFATCVLLFYGIDDNFFGAMFRFHWFCAAVVGLSCFRLGWYKTSGVAFGIAVAERIFPGVLLVGPALLAGVALVRHRRVERRHVVFGSAFLATLAVAFALSLTSGRGIRIWSEFHDAIGAHNEHHFTGTKRIGIKRVFATDLSEPDKAPRRSERQANFEEQHPYYVATLAVLLPAVFASMLLTRERSSMVVGLFLAFCLTVMSRYYWALSFAFVLVSGGLFRQRYKGAVFDVIIVGALPFYYWINTANQTAYLTYTAVDLYIVCSVFLLLVLLAGDRLFEHHDAVGSVAGRPDPWAKLPWRRIALVVAALVASVGLAFAAYSWWGKDPDPRPRTASAGHQATLVSVGDILLGDSSDEVLREHGYQYPFREVSVLFDHADFVLGNLEAPITEHAQPINRRKKYVYKQKRETAAALREAGFDMVTLANNHTLDYGETGLRDTMAALDEAGVWHVGAGLDDTAARAGKILDLNGTRVGVLSYLESYGDYARDGWFAGKSHPGCAKLDMAQVRQDIARLRPQADVILASVHYGENYKPPTKYQLRISRALVDAGADIVNGHHAHIAHGVELYKGKPIVYNLGNFVFGTGGRFKRAGVDGYGLVARYNFDAGRLASIEFDLLHVDNRKVDFQPKLVGKAEARRAWAEINEAYDTEFEWDGSTAVLELPSA